MQDPPSLMNDWVNWSFSQYANGKDRLTRHQMKLAVISMTGKKPTDLPRDQNSFTIEDLEQYVRILNSGNIIGDVCSLYDCIDQDGKGYVTVLDLIAAAEANHANISQAALEDAFQRVDRDRDGRISYRDFMNTVNTGLIELGVYPASESRIPV